MRIIPIIIGTLIAWSMLVTTKTALAEDLIQRSYAIENIQQVQVSAGGTLEISLGEKESLEVIAPVSVINKLRVDGNASTLRINQGDRGFWSWIKGESISTDAERQHTTFKLTLKQLTGLEVDRTMQTKVLSPITSDTFDIKMNGSASLKMISLVASKLLTIHYSGATNATIDFVESSSVRAYGSGASSLTISGKVTDQELHLSGASHYFGKALNSQKVQADASGASELELWVEQTLQSNLSGASTVRYFGNPKIDKKTSGASELYRMGEYPEAI